MDAVESADLITQVEAMKQERGMLLDELEAIYLQVEDHLLASGREREIAYQELREKNRALKNRLEELKEAQADQLNTQQMLIRSERLAGMGQMAASIVHEIKNPLTVILTNLELMMLQGERPQKQNLDLLRQSSEYLNQLSENVLRFARHHRGHASPVDLNALLSDLKVFVRSIVRSMEVHLDLETDIPQVVVDPSHVEQVLMNLILNAVDAVERCGRIWLVTGRSSVRGAIDLETEAGRDHELAVEMEEGIQGGEFVFVEVRDDGPGIPGAHLEQVFQAFFTTKGEEKGTGLGLSIARTIVREWGGNILVSSREGEGTSFKVFVPMEMENGK